MEEMQEESMPGIFYVLVSAGCPAVADVGVYVSTTVAGRGGALGSVVNMGATLGLLLRRRLGNR